MNAALHQLPGRAAFSVAEVCAQTGISRDTVYNAIRSGQLPARRIGRRMIVTQKDLERFLARLPRAREHRKQFASASQPRARSQNTNTPSANSSGNRHCESCPARRYERASGGLV